MTRRDKAELVIVGAGIFGLWTAWAALRRGLDVTVLEAAEVVGAGASGGVVGALAPHMPERWTPKKQFQLEALLVLPDELRAVEAAAGLPTGFRRAGRIVPLVSEAARVRAKARLADAAARWPVDLPMRLGGADDWPGWLAPEAAPFGIVEDAITAQLDPAATCRALAAALEAGGVRVRYGCAVRAVGPGRVEWDGGGMDAEAVMLAAGVAGFDLIAPLVGEVPGRAEKGQALLLDLDGGVRPLIYSNGLYVISHDTGGVAVGATSERVFEGDGPDAMLDDVLARARAFCPMLAGATVRRRWAGLRP
ncbi:FAD-dependent oxidoreductase, partial [Roseobacter sp. HKCCA0434]|uniref:NAD(P)/FAD-dependent oxidoreductase n=1 Tax=Roseobacter sp. HKCCA0434 TaxID=3079297 RepID=UPI002905C997